MAVRLLTGENLRQTVQALILTTAEMQKRADASIADIEAGRVESFSQFSEDFENWKKLRRTHTK